MRTLTKLQTKDYLELYGFFVPEEIKDEFGTRSLSSKAIQNLYKQHYRLSSYDALKDMLEKSHCIADKKVDESEHLGWVYENIAKEREARRKKVWQRLKLVEQIYRWALPYAKAHIIYLQINSLLMVR